MPDINFDCPNCKQNLDAPPEMAGESIACPTCNQSITIPVPAVQRQAEAPRRVVMKKPAGQGGTRPAPATAVPQPEPAATPDAPAVSGKSRLVALLLCFFLGSLGVHRFYAGKIATGILQILTFGGLGIWVLVDLIMIIVGAFSDKKGLRIKNW